MRGRGPLISTGVLGAIALGALLPVWPAGAAEYLDSDDPVARAAVQEVVEKGARGCRLTFTGFDDFTFDVTANLSSKRVSGRHYKARFRVTTGGDVEPQDPTAGELKRRCQGDPGRPKTLSKWLSLPYFNGYHLGAFSNGRWKGAKGVAGGAAKPPSRLADAGDYAVPVWSKRCKSGPQKATFRRKLYLPGPPAFDVLFTAGDYTDPIRYDDPLKVAKIWVNGAQGGKARPGSKPQITVPARLFKYGKNKIEIEAKKRATGRCNGKGGRGSAAGKSRFGARFSLGHNFGADLEVTDRRTGPPPDDVSPAQYYHHEITVTNKGPSGIYAGRLTVIVDPSPNATAADGYVAGIEGGPKGSDCEPGLAVEDSDTEVPDSTVMVCSFKNLKAGKSGTFRFRMLGRPTGKVYEIDWIGALEGYGETNTANNSGSAHTGWCYDSNGDDICG